MTDTLESRTDLDEESTPAAILHILQLNCEAIRIGEVEFGRAALSASAVWHPQGDIGHERSAALSLLLGQPVVDEQLRDLGRIEIGHRHAGVIDAGTSRTGAASRTALAARGRRSCRNHWRCARRWATGTRRRAR